jgi:hypothetical protein
LTLGLAAVCARDEEGSIRAAVYFPRLIAVRRFRQPLDGALLHPLAIGAFLLLQWIALARRLLGRPAAWKGRACTPEAAGPSPRG